jgi:outer membrane lipoprotein-sorting protein
MKTNKTLIIIALFLAFASMSAKDVNSIIEKNLLARGGKKNLEGIKSSEAKVNMTAMGMEMPMKLYSKKPAKARMEMSVMGQNMITAYDGVKAYVSQNGTVMELDPEQSEKVKEQMKSQSNSYENPLVNYAEKGIKIELAGAETIDGEDFDILKITDKEGKISKIFINTKTGIDFKINTKQQFQDVEKDVDIFFEDNKNVDGILVPHKMVIKTDGEEFAVMKFEYIKFNVNLEDSLFKLESK